MDPSKHPFAKKHSVLDRRETLVRALLRSGTYFVLICTALIFLDIFIKGAPVVFQSSFPFVSLDFLTKSPETLIVYQDDAGNMAQASTSNFDSLQSASPDVSYSIVDSYSYSAGGILGPLVGTAFLVLICMAVALTIGVASSIFLSEYATGGRMISGVRLAILNLAGVPSIVFGLFGLGFFCYTVPNIVSAPAERSLYHFQIPFTSSYFSMEGWDACVLAGGCTLAIMILPVIITACEESLRAVPKGYREGSLALGATKWQTIRKAVLPYAFPGILTASILGITRVAGETAPIMFTAAVAHKDKLPWQGLEGSAIGRLFDFFFQNVQALPYHIYTVSAKIPQSEYNKDMQYGSVFVFMMLVFLFASFAVFLRIRIRKQLKW